MGSHVKAVRLISMASSAAPVVDLNEKVCIITGSARGLGKEFARRFLQAGARVTISDLKEDIAQEALQELRTDFGENRVNLQLCDVTNDVQLEALFDASEKFFGAPIDVLVNNAGVNTNFGWRKCMEVNIMAVMSASEMALERMKGRPGCKIVNIGSVAGLTSGESRHMSSYFVSKRAVVELTRCLAASRKHEHHVDVQCLCPAWADTNIVSSVEGANAKSWVKKSANSLGMMPVEDVGNAMMELLARPNGTVLMVAANTPRIEVGYIDTKRVIASIVISRFLNKVFGVEVVQHWHLVLFVAIVLFFVHLCIAFYLF